MACLVCCYPIRHLGGDDRNIGSDVMDAAIGIAGMVALFSFLFWPRKPKRMSRQQQEFLVARHNQQMANRLGPPMWGLPDRKIDEA